MDRPKIVVFWRSGSERLMQVLPGRVAADIVSVNSGEELAGEIGDSEALVLSGLEYSAEVLRILSEHGQRLRWIQSTSAGIDKFLECGIPDGVVFTRGGGLWDKPVAEHAMALILTFARQIRMIDRLQRHREWAKWPVDAAIHSLEGKVLGILGYGMIGRELARKGRAFDMEVWALRRTSLSTPDDLVDRMLGPEELSTLLEGSDYLVVCLPLTPQTEKLIGTAALRTMKASAVLINVARGGIVDEQALVEIVEGGHLAGVGLDAFAQEPLPPDHPFWRMEKVIVSPHVAGATRLREEKVLNLLEDNISRFLEGRPLLYPVDVRAGY